MKVIFNRGSCWGTCKSAYYCLKKNKKNIKNATSIETSYSGLCPDFHSEAFYLKIQTKCPPEGQGHRVFFLYVPLRCMRKAVRTNGSCQVASTSIRTLSTSLPYVPLQHRVRCLSVTLPGDVTLQQSIWEPC